MSTVVWVLVAAFAMAIFCVPIAVRRFRPSETPGGPLQSFINGLVLGLTATGVGVYLLLSSKVLAGLGVLVGGALFLSIARDAHKHIRRGKGDE